MDLLDLRQTDATRAGRGWMNRNCTYQSIAERDAHLTAVDGRRSQSGTSTCDLISAPCLTLPVRSIFVNRLTHPATNREARGSEPRTRRAEHWRLAARTVCPSVVRTRALQGRGCHEGVTSAPSICRLHRFGPKNCKLAVACDESRKAGDQMTSRV